MTDRANDAAASSTNERRTESRRRVVKKGTISYFDGRFTMRCTVCEISERGAILSVPNCLEMPRSIELHIDLDGTAAPCEVVWRRMGCIGIRFSGPARRKLAQPVRHAGFAEHGPLATCQTDEGHRTAA